MKKRHQRQKKEMANFLSLDTCSAEFSNHDMWPLTEIPCVWEHRYGFM